MVIKKKKHICSTRGCRNRDTVMFAKFSSTVGVTFICKQCVDELAAWYGNVSGDDTETAENVVEAPENVVEATDGVEEAADSVDVAENVEAKKETTKKNRKTDVKGGK